MRGGGSWLARAAVMVAVAVALAVGLLAGGPQALAATGKPGAPTGVTAVARDQGAVVSWTAPSSDGGSPVTGYVITASPGGATVHTAAVTSFLVGGLANGTAYTFTVAAVNASGMGPASSPSAAVTPQPPTVPGAARSVAAVAGFEQATVSWAAPKSDGGAPVTSYQITTRPATSAVTVAGSARSAVVAGLADGTAYQVQVAAVNSVGTGTVVASASVTPQVTAPDAPTGVTAAPTATGVKVGWQPPASDGGSAVTGYLIAVTGTATTVTAAATARSATITGLTAGTSYTFTVAATNAQGQGPAATSTPATGGATVAAQTVVLSKASLATLTQVGTDGSLTFTSPTSQVKGLAAGDVLAAGVSAATPDGLLAQVTSVTPAGSTVTVATTPASLDQALSAGGFGATTALTSGQVTAFSPARRGVQLLPADRVPASAAPGSIGVSVNVDLYTDNHDAQVSVQGSLTLTPHLSFAASITCCVHTSSQFTGTVTATDSLTLSAQLSHDISTGIDLGTFTFAPITVTVAGVPVVIVPDLSLKLAANGTVSIGTVTAGSTLTVGANVTTSDATVTATPIYQLKNSFTPPTVQEPFSAAIGPQAELGTHIDGLPGPFLTDTLSLPKLTVDPTGDPWWTLGGENELTLNYELSLLHHDFVNYSKTLSDINFLVSHSLDPYQDVTITPSPAAVAPGGQIQLHAQVTGVTNQAVTWKAPTGGGTITAGGLYTAPTTPGTYTITATQPASGLKPAATGLISIRVGHQPPSPPTSPAATSTSYGTATITWTPPADTGGGTITGYTVTASPGGQTGHVPGTATSATIGGLTPGASYTFTVTATNDGGTSVPSPATSPVVIDNVGGNPPWTPIHAPLPANAGSGTYASLSSAACPSSTSCLAAGSYADSSGHNQGLLLSGSGTTWTPKQVPVLANAATDPQAGINAVACPSTSTCAAVGTYDDSAGDVQGMLVTGSGSSWTAVEAPVPANAATSPALAYADVNSVACPSTSECVAVGNYADSAGTLQGMLLTGSGTSWTAIEAPLPPGAHETELESYLPSVACPSTSMCVAVGQSYDSGGNARPLLLKRSGGTWTAVNPPLPGNSASTPSAALSSVACASTSSCTATGNYQDSSNVSDGLLVTKSGPSWQSMEAPLPANADPLQGGSPGPVTCPSSCVATGLYSDASASGHVLLLTGSGTSWTAGEAPQPADSSGDVISASSVACPSTSACVITGWYDTSSLEQAFLLTSSGGAWAGTQAPLPADAASVPVPALQSVACASATACLAVGSYFDSSGHEQGLLVTGPS